MKKLFVSLAVAMLLVLVLADTAYAATGVTDPVVLSPLAQVRQATANYHDVNAAMENGLVPTSLSVQGPELGGGIRGKPGLGTKPR